MRKFILYIFFFFCSFSLKGQQCFISLGDATGIEVSSSELSQLEAAACALIDSLPAEFRDSFKVFDAGFYLHHPRYDGGVPQVFEKLKAKAAFQSKYYLLIGRYSDYNQINKGIKIAVHLPVTGILSCLNTQKLAGIEYTLNTIGEQQYDNSKPYHTLLQTLFETLQTTVDKVVCECDTNSNQACLYDFKTIQDELLRLEFRRIEGVKLGTPYPVNPALESANIYDYLGKEIEVPQLPHERIRLGEELLEGKQILDTLTTIVNEDTTITSITSITGAVYILGYEDFFEWIGTVGAGGDEAGNRSNDSTVWDRAVAASGNYDYVEYWVVLQDPVSGQVYLYSKFTFEPLYGEEMASGIERSASLSPMGMALKVLGNAAVDALLQTLEIRLTQENINTWPDAFYAINKTQVLYSGLSSLIPWKNGVLGTIGQAIVNALGVVISNASKNPNYTVHQGLNDFVMGFGISVMTGHFGPKIVASPVVYARGSLKIASQSSGGIKNLFIKKARFCFGKGACFVKDTPILMVSKPTIPILVMAALPLISPIQNIKPDDIVKAYHHEEAYLTASNDEDIYVPGWQDYDYQHITPETWQIGTFEIIEANGSKVEVEANRPKTWYSENSVNAIGDKAHFYMPEIGINGEATLLSIRPTTVNTTNLPLNQFGQVDRPVITTFKRYAPVVYDYHFSDGGIIGATPEHPFYSVDRQAYIAVGELQLGEQVMTAGEKIVKFIAGKQRDKGEPVYNIEVWREHNYFVSGKDGGEWLLVHNTCPWELIDDILKTFSKSDLLNFVDDVWKNGLWKERGNILEMLMRKTKFKDWKYANDLAKNFKAIDFYRYVNGKNIAASMKTTKVTDVQTWISQNLQHLRDLVYGKNSRQFIWGNNPPIKADIVQLKIFTETGFSTAQRTAWKNAIESHTGGKIQVIIETIQENL